MLPLSIASICPRKREMHLLRSPCYFGRSSSPRPYRFSSSSIFLLVSPLVLAIAVAVASRQIFEAFACTQLSLLIIIGLQHTTIAKTLATPIDLTKQNTLSFLAVAICHFLAVSAVSPCHNVLLFFPHHRLWLLAVSCVPVTLYGTAYVTVLVPFYSISLYSTYNVLFVTYDERCTMLYSNKSWFRSNCGLTMIK